MYWTFIVIAGSLIVTLIVVTILPLLKIQKKKKSKKDLELDFLKNQLKQIEIDINAGSLEKSDGEYNRAKISRSILTILDPNKNALNHTSAPKNMTFALMIVIIFVLSFGTYITYSHLGNLDFQKELFLKTTPMSYDLKSSFLSQEDVESFIKKKLKTAESNSKPTKNQPLIDLITKLKAVLEDRPNDLTGYKLLVKHSLEINDYITARKAQKTIIEILNTKVTSFEFSSYAEFCILAARNYVSPQAEAAIKMALKLNSKNNQAKFYSTLLLFQKDQPYNVEPIWIELIRTEPPESKWVKLILRQILKIMSDGSKTFSTVTKSSKSSLTLQALSEIEAQLELQGGSIEDWNDLIKVYKNLNLIKQMNGAINRAKKFVSLNTTKVEKLTLGLLSK